MCQKDNKITKDKTSLITSKADDNQLETNTNHHINKQIDKKRVIELFDNQDKKNSN